MLAFWPNNMLIWMQTTQVWLTAFPTSFYTPILLFKSKEQLSIPSFCYRQSGLNKHMWRYKIGHTKSFSSVPI